MHMSTHLSPALPATVIDVRFVEGILGLILLEVAREDAAACFRCERVHSSGGKEGSGMGMVERRDRCCEFAGVRSAFERVD